MRLWRWLQRKLRNGASPEETLREAELKAVEIAARRQMLERQRTMMERRRRLEES